jgi:hypothetical protein
MPLISVSKSKEIRGNAHSFFSTTQIKSLSQFRIVLLSCIWSPIVWRSGLRQSANFGEATYLALDFDDGRWMLRDAKKWVKDNGWAAIIGTSKSHQKEKVSPDGTVQPATDRFRIVIPFERTISRGLEYRAVMETIFRDIPCDPACKDGARFFYPCKEIYHEQNGGTFVLPDVSNLLKQYEKPLSDDDLDDQQDIRAGVWPMWLTSALNYGVPAGQRNTTLFRIAATLAGAGYGLREIEDIVNGSFFDCLGREEREHTIRSGFQSTKT